MPRFGAFAPTVGGEKPATRKPVRQIVTNLPRPEQQPPGVSPSPQPNGLYALASVLSLVLLFIHFSNLTELSYTVLGVNLKIMYWFTPFVYISVIFAGGVPETLKHKAGVFFVLFFGWMVLATPFSSWIGGSVGRIRDFGIICAPLLFVAYMAVPTWAHLRKVFGVLALAGAVTLASVAVFGVSSGQDRLQLSSSGTLGNSNDLAAHLILLLPFLLWVVTDSKRNAFIRIISLALIGYGVFAILYTGSRGALVALAPMVLFVIWKASMKIRVGFVLASAVLALSLPMVLPEQTKERLGNLFGDQHKEADESRAAREYLFRQSVRFSFEYPLFGVGPDQFSIFEGYTARGEGHRGSWHATHCAWTQVSSECGLPALLFLLLSLGTSIPPVFRVYKEARRLQLDEITNAAFCFLLGIVGFLVAITFLANAYRYYLPVIIGLAIAFHVVAQREIAASSKSENPRTVAA